MAKYPPKRLDNQSNQRTSINRHVKVKRPKNIQQQSSRKAEEMKVDAIMEKLDDSNGNRHKLKTNINHFAPLFESDNKEGTTHSTKPNTPTIVLIEDDQKMKKLRRKKQG